MKTYKKIDGYVFEYNKEDKKSSDNKSSKPKIMKDLIDYDKVDVIKYRSANITVHNLVDGLSKENIEIIYNDIIKCKDRDTLISILDNVFEIGIKKVKKAKKYEYLNDSNFKIISDDLKSVIQHAMDTSLYSMVSKIISIYCRNAITSLKEDDFEKFNQLEYEYSKNTYNFESIFTDVSKISDPDIKKYVLITIKYSVRRNQPRKNNGHLCFDCPIAFADCCPKIAAQWPKHLKDFDFITDGSEVDYENINEMEYISSGDNVKELIVSGCKLKEESEEKKYKRKSIFFNND